MGLFKAIGKLGAKIANNNYADRQVEQVRINFF